MGLFELKKKTITKKVKRQIKSDGFVFSYIKKHNDFKKQVMSLSLNYLSGKISENKLCMEILDLKFKLDEINDEVSKLVGSEVYKIIKNQVNLEMYYYSAFFDDFFKSDKKDSVLCDFVVNLSILGIDFFNNL